MQSKTPLIALIAILCVSALGWLLWDSSGSASIVEWNQEDIVAISKEDLAEQIQTDETTDPERDEFAGSEGDANEVRPLVMIRGRVVNKLTAPVAGAKVALSAQGRGQRSRVSVEIVTKSDGTFTFSGKGFTRMSVSLQVTHQDYAMATAFKPFDDAKGELDMGDIEIVVGGTVIGSITDMTGNVVQYATASLSSADRRGGFRGRFTRGSSRQQLVADANTSGVFRIEHVPPGRYQVTGSAPHRQRASKGPITVIDAQEERLEPIQLGPGYQLIGTVLDSKGQKLEDAEVQVRGGRFRGNKDSDKEGKFLFDHMSPGEYRVEVEAKGYLTNTEHSGIEVTESGPLTIIMKPGLRVLGVVTDAVTGLPVTSYAARVRRMRSLPNPEADRQRAETSAIFEQFRQLRAANDGKPTEVQQAEMGKLMEKLRESGGMGAAFGGRGGNRGGSRGGDRGSSRGGDRGSSRGGDRGSSRGGRTVEISYGSTNTGDSGRRGRSSFGNFDFGRRGNSNLPGDTGDVKEHPEGKFLFEGLQEGIYVVDIGSPDHEKVRSMEVELREGIDSIPLALVVQRGITVSGTVMSKTDREPISNAEIELRLVAEEQPQSATNPRSDSGRGRGRGGFGGFQMDTGPRTSRIMTVKTAPNGTFTFKNAPAGRYLIRAEADDFARTSTDPFQLKTDYTEMTIALGALAVIEGRVSGIPIGKVTEARVMAFSQPRTMKDAKVREDGTYVITGLEPGDYTVRAFLGDSRRFIFQEMFRGMSFTSGTTAQAPQVDVKVKEASRNRFNVTLTQNLTGSVVGKVLINGNGAQGYRVSLRKVEQDTGQPGQTGSRWGGMFGRGSSATVDQNGEYEIKNVNIGQYTLSVSQASGSGRGRRSSGNTIARQQVFISAEQTVTAAMVSINYGSLTGTITIPPETPELQGVTNNTKPPESQTENPRSSGGRISLYQGVTEVPDPSLDNGAEVIRFSARIRDNKFEFKELPIGDYLIQIRLSGRDSITKTVYVGAGEQTKVEVTAGNKRGAKTKAGQPSKTAPGGSKGK